MTKFPATFGDWVPPPPAKKCSIHLTAAWYYLLNTRQLSKIAAALGHHDDAETYSKLYHTQLVHSFNQAFFNGPKQHTYDVGVQTALVLPLWLGDATPVRL
jgi:alpha-L-rhamnosidase